MRLTQGVSFAALESGFEMHALMLLQAGAGTGKARTIHP